MPSRPKKKPGSRVHPWEQMQPKIMVFTVKGGDLIFTGKMTVPDGDETVHLPMMIVGLLPKITEKIPGLCGVESITITASLKPSK